MYVCKYEKLTTKKLVTLNITDEVYQLFKKNIGDRPVSYVIEDFMRSVNEEKAKEKELIAPLDKSAISGLSMNNQSSNNQSSILTLDIYLPKTEINKHISGITELSELREIRDKSKDDTECITN